MEVFEEDDDFQDAVESQPAPEFMDMDTAINEAKIAVDYFFNNKFEEAKSTLQPWAKSSMYHAVGTSVFCFLEAMLTFEHGHIETASESLKQCIALCNRHRKKKSISEALGKMVKRSNYDHYTAEEIHAELCFAEALLLKSMLTFVEDETLVSFIKAGFKIRSCFSSYKECSNILHHKNWGPDAHKVHFESGVRMGIGAFNLMISLLPGRIIKLLEFMGFSGSKRVGLHELEAGYRLHTSIRQVLCVITLLGYHLIVVYTLSDNDGDLAFSEEILSGQLKMYPNGVWFLFFMGRLEFVKGNVENAIKWYKKSWESQKVWPQFHHLCFWELMWASSIQQKWRDASEYASYLLDASCWSRTTYSYLKASMLIMLGDKMTVADQKVVELLMKDAPKWKQRIAGKSLPMEKFVVKKTERFFTQGCCLVLPALEMLYVWNLFKIVGKKWEHVENIYKVVEKTLSTLEKNKGKSAYDADNIALALLLKGACLRQMKSPLQAELCLNSVIAMESQIKEDNYLVPFTMVELALLHRQQGEVASANQLIDDAKKNYTSYNLESRLHFKIHAFQTDMTEATASGETSRQ